MSRAAVQSDEVCIDAQNVRVVMGGHVVLDDVSMNLCKDEIVTIIGPNGAGKTVLVRALIGLVRPASGRIHRRRGLKVGYVPQKLSFDPILPLSARRFLRLSNKGNESDIERVLAALKITALQEEMIFTLSGGELQRLLIARAILGRPDVLILDEPTQGIDMTGQLELYRLIEKIRNETQCGVLMVSHDLHLVMAATDHVICLNQHVCCSGHPESVSQNPAYLTLFGDKPADEIAVYTHHHDHRHAPSGEIVEFASGPKVNPND